MPEENKSLTLDAPVDSSNPVEELFDSLAQEKEEEYPLFPDEVIEDKPLKPKKDEKRETIEAEDKTNDETKTKDKSLLDEGEDETTFIDPWIEAFHDRYGWDIPEDDKPKDLEGMLDFIETIVSTSSKPKYASEDAQRFDEFIRNGGDKEKFFEDYNHIIDIENADLKDQDNQKVILEEYLREKGMSQKMIQNMLDKAIKTDSLEEDAEEAASELKDIYKTRQEQLVKDQAKAKKLQDDDLNTFITDVRSTVTNIDQIFGIELTRQDKEKLLPYVFQTQNDGKTQQQRDYENDPVGYTIMTAYAYMMKDKLMTNLEGKAKSKEVKSLKQKLNDLSKKRIKSDVVPDMGESDFLSEFGV